MGKLEKTLGQEEKSWPQSFINKPAGEEWRYLIEKDELGKWQRYFCDISAVFLCAVDEEGVPLTELGGNPQEAERIERLIDGEQFQSMFQRVAESELEDRAVERTAYPNFRLAVVTSKVERKAVVNWLVCGIMEEAEDVGEYENPPLEGFSSVLNEEHFLRVVDTLKAITDDVIAERLFLRRVQSGQEKSAHLEQSAEEKLKNSELLREMMWLLGGSDPFQETTQKLLKKIGEYLQLDIAAVYHRAQGQQPQILAKWTIKETVWEFELEPKLPWPPLFTVERSLILSSNTMLGEEEKEEMDSLSLKALIIMPIKMGMNEEYWVCFGVTEKERIWKLDEIRFLGEAVRILQRILIKQSKEATHPKRRGTSNTNKRKKK